jgi:hypothetical protein
MINVYESKKIVEQQAFLTEIFLPKLLNEK